MVVEERENILPGFAQTLTTTLDAGDYQMTCGLAQQSQGHVEGRGHHAPRPPSPRAMDLVGPIARIQGLREGGSRRAGRRDERSSSTRSRPASSRTRRKLYAPAHQHYERIEPIAELFNDLDGSMDSREDDFEKKADDPKFTGFHRLEKGLFTDKSTDGLAPFADKLMADTLDLQKRIDGLDHRSEEPRRRRGGTDRGGRLQEDQRRRGPIQPHRSLGLPGQYRRRAEDRRAARSADRQAGRKTERPAARQFRQGRYASGQIQDERRRLRVLREAQRKGSHGAQGADHSAGRGLARP